MTDPTADPAPERERLTVRLPSWLVTAIKVRAARLRCDESDVVEDALLADPTLAQESTP